MNKSKSKFVLKIIIVTVIIMLFLIGGIAYAYFSTDVFKTNKEIFLKYASQLFRTESGFIDNGTIKYYEKKDSNFYSNNGKISADISSELSGKRLENAKNFNITFSGDVDGKNSQIKQNINLNYSTEVKFPITYLKTSEMQGLQTKYIGSKYIATKSIDNILKGINQQASTDILTIQSKIQKSDIETIGVILEKYMNNIYKDLKNSSFTKISTEQEKGYKLNLSGEEIQNILLKVLEQFEQDEISIEQINQICLKINKDLKITSSMIKDTINSINKNEKLKDESIGIELYTNNQEIYKIVLTTQNAKVQIQKTNSQYETNYKIDIEELSKEDAETKNKITFNATYTGLSTLESINENYELVFNINGQTNKYKFENAVEFKDNAQIDKINEDNAIILDNCDEQYASNLIGAIQDRITIVNEQQMQDIGVTATENPILDIFVHPLLEAIGQDLDTTETQTELILSFNARFEVYESSNSKGTIAKGLLSTILINNQNNNYKIKEINLDGTEYETTEENITLVKSNISTEDSYKIEFEKDATTGIINRVVINKK